MSIYYVGCIPYTDELYHFGILGQKWGVRRYQNKDGTLTEAGKIRYSSGIEQQKLADLVTRKGVRKNEVAYNKAKMDVYASPQVQHAIRNVRVQAKNANEASKNVEKIENTIRDEIYGNQKNYEKWLNIAVENYQKNANIDIDFWTDDEVKDMYKYEDFDQGENGLFETYVRESKTDLARQYTNAVGVSAKADKKLENASRKYAEQFLGDYKDQIAENLYPWVKNRMIALDSLTYTIASNAKDESRFR